MTDHGLWRCVLAGVLFGSYPFVVSVSGLRWLPAGIILSAVSLMVFITILTMNPPPEGITSPAFLLRPETMGGAENVFAVLGLGIALVAISGLMNGGGHAVFQPLLAAPSENQISRIGIVVPIVGVAIAIPLGWVFNREAITTDKMVATALAVGAILAASGRWRSLLP